MVAGLLHLREHVRREDHGAAGGPGLAGQVEHDRPRRGIEVRRRLVEDHERHVSGEHHREGEFLPHAGAHPTHLPGAVEPQPVGHAARRIAATLPPQARKEIEHAIAVHPPEEPRLAREIGGAGPHLQRLRGTIEAGDAGHAGRRREIAQERPQERGLAGAVGPEQAKDLSLAHVERAAVEGRKRAIPLREGRGADDHRRLGSGGTDGGSGGEGGWNLMPATAARNNSPPGRSR